MDDAAATGETLDSFVTDAASGLSPRDTAAGEPAVPGVGSIIAERYLLERALGQGGMGAVFAGRHVVTGRRVAIKLLRGDPVCNRVAALRMAREARAVGRIQHANVVAVYDAGFAAARPFIAMELLDGESLEQRIERTGPMSEREAISTLQQIARGVEAAHANGIIHRDLKPANILLCVAPDGSDLVKVVDFGISKLRGDAEEDVLVTSQGVQLGTPVFMSPEQVRGDLLDERTDVYALAVILYYTLTQRFPFHAGNRAELFVKILTAQPEPLAQHRSGISAELAAVVLKGLARDRAHRYESVAALADALSRAISRRRRSRTAAFASRVVGLAAAVSGIVLIAMPTRLMHAAPTMEAAVAVEAQAVEPRSMIAAPLANTQSADMPLSVRAAGHAAAAPDTLAATVDPSTVLADTQPSAAAPALKPARSKTRGPRPGVARPAPLDPEESAPIARDDTADKVKLMGW